MNRPFGSNGLLSGGVIFSAEKSGISVLAWPSLGLWRWTTCFNNFLFEEVLVFEPFQFRWGYMAEDVCKGDLSRFTVNYTAELGANDERSLPVVALMS